jgi:VNT family MFS transporter (synaptic vesicle glycoprotein 2)
VLLQLPPLTQVGVGLFQWGALAVCGLANAADAVEILGMSLVLPAAEADPEFVLTSAGKFVWGAPASLGC